MVTSASEVRPAAAPLTTSPISAATCSGPKYPSAIAITPGFLQTAHIQLLRGRDFTIADNKDAPRVVLIDENAARAWFPNQDPLGHQLRALDKPGDPPKWAPIVGVVRPVVYDRLTRLTGNTAHSRV